MPATCSRILVSALPERRPGKKTLPTGPILAAKNKSLALSNKSRTGVEATKRRNRQMNGYPVRLDESPVNAIIPIKRPSDDDVVQTAPVKCRYTESGVCANIAGFAFARRRISCCRRKQSSGIGVEQGNICHGGSVAALPHHH